VDKFHRSASESYQLRLASVDGSSLCVVWDVTQGTVLSEFKLGSKPLVDLQWLETNVCIDVQGGRDS